jgi:hypothetical protein
MSKCRRTFQASIVVRHASVHAACGRDQLPHFFRVPGGGLSQNMDGGAQGRSFRGHSGNELCFRAVREKDQVRIDGPKVHAQKRA